MQGSAWIRVTTTGVPATARPGHRRHLTQVSVGKIRPVTTFVARAPRRESSSALWSRPAQRRLLHHRSRQQLGTPPAAPRPTPRADHLQARLELCQRRAAPQRQRPTQRPTHRQQQRAPQPDRATQRRPPAAGHGVNPQSGPGGQHETTPPSSSAAPAPTHHDGLTRPGLDHWGHAEPAIPSQAIARWMWRSPNPTSARDRIAPARGGRTPPNRAQHATRPIRRRRRWRPTHPRSRLGPRQQVSTTRSKRNSIPTRHPKHGQHRRQRGPTVTGAQGVHVGLAVVTGAVGEPGEVADAGASGSGMPCSSGDAKPASRAPAAPGAPPD